METKSKITFEKQHIEDQEFKILLEAFNAATMSPEGLAFYAGSLRVTIDGYAADLSPVRVPELRTFLQELIRQWGLPAAIHYCDFRSSFFTMILLSQFNCLTVVERDQESDMVAFCRRSELEEFALKALQGLWETGRRARLKPAAIRRREKQFLTELAMTFRFFQENEPSN